MTKPDNSKKPPGRKPAGARRPLREREFTLYGWNACRQVFQTRPQDILRVYFLKDRARQVMDIKKWCRDHKLPYRELDVESLNKAAASVHHEGLVMVVRPRPPEQAHALVERGVSPQALLVGLDGVGNAHNVGAILRTCAFFGAEGLVLGMSEAQARLTGSAARTAEGALELVPVYECRDLPSILRDMKRRGVFVVGADATAPTSLYDAKIPFPCMVVVGNEAAGLSPRVRDRCDLRVRVPGAGDMQSLNVSVALGILLSELFQQRQASPMKTP